MKKIPKTNVIQIVLKQGFSIFFLRQWIKFVENHKENSPNISPHMIHFKFLSMMRKKKRTVYHIQNLL